MLFLGQSRESVWTRCGMRDVFKSTTPWRWESKHDYHESQYAGFGLAQASMAGKEQLKPAWCGQPEGTVTMWDGCPYDTPAAPSRPQKSLQNFFAAHPWTPFGCRSTLTNTPNARGFAFRRVPFRHLLRISAAFVRKGHLGTRWKARCMLRTLCLRSSLVVIGLQQAMAKARVPLFRY